MAIHCLMINGSSRRAIGNSAKLMGAFRAQSQSNALDFEFRELKLVDQSQIEAFIPLLQWADAFVFATGTYWDSWGWPLQRFLESVTKTEGTKIWLGKPAAVLVTMHSVGGKSVLSRLQGVLNTLGVLIPPMSGIVISAVGQAALKVDDSELVDDIWRPSDLEIVAANLHVAVMNGRANGHQDYRSWEIDRTGFENLWLE